MKKILCLLLLVLFMLPLTAEARREPDYIGKSKAQETLVSDVSGGTQIVRGDAKIWMINFAANGVTAIGGWITLYDAYTGYGMTEANILCEIEVASAAASETVVLDYPIDTSNGLVVVGENGTYVILYE